MPHRIPKIEIQELREDSMKFLLYDTDTSVANSLRRVMIAEVPTLAIELVSIETNTSVMSDEFLSHRLGMIPIRYLGELTTFQKRFVYAQDCDCEETCPSCTVYLYLEVESKDGLTTVTSNDLRSEDPFIEPVKFSSEEERNNSQDVGIIITKLGKGQSVKLTALARLGIGKEHAKWSPVGVATYMYEPIITLNQDAIESLSQLQKEEFVFSCPTKVYGISEETDEIIINNSLKCMYCDECVKTGASFKKAAEDDNVVSVQMNDERFIFSLETTGQLRPEEVLAWALDILRLKFASLRHICADINIDGTVNNQPEDDIPF